MTTRNKKTSLENTDGMVTQTGIPLLYRMVPEPSILNEDLEEHWQGITAAWLAASIH